MKKTIFIIYFISSFLNLLSQTEWKLKKNSNGIKVYTRNIENSNVCEFKATTIINASIDDIYKIIADANKYSEWVDQVSYSKSISKKTSGFVVYYQIKLPIGFKNRDIVLNNEIEIKTKQKLKLKLKSVPQQYPNQNKYKRIKIAYGYWLLSASGEKTIVTYQFYSNPEGNFPASIINLFLVEGPYKTLKNLQNKF